MKKAIILLISLILTAAMTAGCAGTHSGPSTISGGIRTIRADLPDTAYKGTARQFLSGEKTQEWLREHIELINASREIQGSTSAFFGSVMKEILTAEETGTVCSPLNIYIALSVLAEMADGSTQEQILSVLGADSIETVRNNAGILWKANYTDTPVAQSRLANSVWLREEGNADVYNEELLSKISEDYFADSFRGVMGSEEMNKAIRKWTDEATGNLLKEYTSEISTEPDTLLEIISTIYYKAMWGNRFDSSRNENRIFHGKSGDKECEMMTSSAANLYIWGDNFSAVSQNISEGGSMFFILPDEGSSPSDVLGNPQMMEALNAPYGEYADSSYLIVNEFIPKFRTSSKSDLREVLKKLGMTDAFDKEAADFTPLEGKDYPYDNPYVNKIDHAAMVEIDEEGVTGAAYTEIALAGAGMPPSETVDFVLDRPFIFVITASDGSILFAGTVYDIN